MTPPHNSIVAVSNRPRKYKDIPFVSQLGVFAEENLAWSFAPGRKLYLQAGVRFDQIFDFKHAFSPRINLAVNILKDQALTLRGGWGILSKAPTVGYLYPDRAYFDFVNFNSMTDQTVPEDKRLAMVTTRAFDTENRDRLEIAKNYKSEIGIDSQFGGMFFSVTGYYEKMNNGYMLSSSYDTWQWMQYDIYRSSGLPSPSGFPALTLANSYGYLASYLAPSNNITDISKGVELSLDFGRINSIRTSFTLNGAYMSNLFYENGPTFYNRDSGLTDQFHVGIYEGESEKLHRERLVTTLRATHNIPRIGLVITLTAQVTWMEKEWSSFGNDSIPIGYLDVFDHGARKAFSMSDFEKLTPGTQEYKAMEAILKTTYDYRYRVERRPPLLLMNINVTKEFKKNLRVSFFANNMFMSYPVYKSRVNPGEQYRRNPNLFFGLELVAIIK